MKEVEGSSEEEFELLGRLSKKESNDSAVSGRSRVIERKRKGKKRNREIVCKKSQDLRIKGSEMLKNSLNGHLTIQCVYLIISPPLSLSFATKKIIA
jgi:hypothetical protein